MDRSLDTKQTLMAALLGDAPLRESMKPELIIGMCGALAGTSLILLTRGRLALAPAEIVTEAGAATARDAGS